MCSVEEVELSDIEAIEVSLAAVNKDALRDHSLKLTLDTEFVKQDNPDLENDPDGDLRFQESPSGDRLKSSLPTRTCGKP